MHIYLKIFFLLSIASQSFQILNEAKVQNNPKISEIQLFEYEADSLDGKVVKGELIKKKYTKYDKSNNIIIEKDNRIQRNHYYHIINEYDLHNNLVRSQKKSNHGDNGEILYICKYDSMGNWVKLRTVKDYFQKKQSKSCEEREIEYWKLGNENQNGITTKFNFEIFEGRVKKIISYHRESGIDCANQNSRKVKKEISISLDGKDRTSKHFSKKGDFTSETTTYLDDSLRVVKYHNYSRNSQGTSTSKYNKFNKRYYFQQKRDGIAETQEEVKYDDRGNVTQRKSLDFPGFRITEYKYKEFNEKGDWVKRQYISKNKVQRIEERIIKYYN